MKRPRYLMVNAVQVLGRRETFFFVLERTCPREREQDVTVLLIPPSWSLFFKDSLSSGDDEDYGEDPEDAGNGNGEFLF